MPSRSQITLESSLARRAKQRARDMGISFAEYVRRLIDQDLSGDSVRPRLDDLIGAGDSGGSDVALHEDEYLNEAFGRS
ncbi:MAG TPA: hypothetical protein VJ938_07000 [Acidimicrobiia bacterium]|nr:hypothetical protein [Acidimicrobiia bacterium]